MYVFTIDCPNAGLVHVTETLLEYGARSSSRNGDVLRFTVPVCLRYDNPRRRILDWDARDANHFFHHFEAMWMLAGREDLAPLTFFNKGISQYSDDGLILRGTAYGRRWRHHYGFDQLEAVIKRLTENPDDRRGVLTMWDPQDLVGTTQDFACNMQVIFTTRPDMHGNMVLDMTVTNRSNDLIYGSMGSNLFHFSLLHEYVAKRTRIPIGSYFQISTNLHLYVDNPVASRVLDAVRRGDVPPESPDTDTSLTDLHERENIPHQPFDNLVSWGAASEHDDEYIAKVARPLAQAYAVFKQGSTLPKGKAPSKADRLALASEILTDVPSPLGAAGLAWLERRLS